MVSLDDLRQIDMALNMYAGENQDPCPGRTREMTQIGRTVARVLRGGYIAMILMTLPTLLWASQLIGELAHRPLANLKTGTYWQYLRILTCLCVRLTC